jgi:hypothetical protein
MNKKQNGFSVVEGLLIFIIVGILGGTGWYVYNSNKKTNDLLNSADKASSLASAASKSKSMASQEKYYEIKDLKLKILLTPETQDLISTTSSKGVYFSLKSFVDAVDKAGATEILSDGVNDCERIVSVSLFGSNERSTLESDPIFNYKFDVNGKPLDKNVIQLEDGRYGVIGHGHWSCYKDPGINKQDPLFQVKNDAIKKIDNLLMSNLHSY